MFLIILACIICFVAFLSVVSYAKLNLTRTAKMVNKFPQLPRRIFLGSIQTFNEKPEEIHERFSSIIKLCGRCFAFWGMHDPYIFIADAKLIKKVLSSPSCQEKGNLYKDLEWFLGKGLLTSNGDVWRHDRKLLNPSFKTNKFGDFIKSFNLQAQILVSMIEKNLANSSEEMLLHCLFSKCSIDALTESAFGKSSCVQQDCDTQVLPMMQLASSIFRERAIKPWLTIPIISYICGWEKAMTTCASYFDEILGKVISERKKALWGGMIKEDDIIFIDCLLDKKSDAEIKSHVNTIFMTGFETTANTAHSALFLLALHPEIQKKVYSEIIEIFGDDREITLEDLTKLKYLEMCIKETLRIYPTAPIMTRHVSQDVPLDDGLVIPKGVEVTFLIANLHNDPIVFPNPEKFDPDRFQPDEIAKRHAYSFIPFSVSTRSCIGQKYAMLQIKTLLVHVLKNFEISTNVKQKDIKLVLGVILRLSRDIPFRLIKRCNF